MPISSTTPQPPLQRTPTAICILVGLLLIAAVAAIYIQTLQASFFNLDDNDYVANNSHVASGISPVNLVWAMTQRHSGNWHPVAWVSHMIDCQIYGLKPAGHHATNMLLHAANAVLLMLVLSRLTGRFWPAAVAAALFAVHPLRVESVAWVAERKDVLSGFFFFLTLLAYERYVRLRRPGSFSVVVIFFILGLMSKPMLVTLPALLLLLDIWPLGRLSTRTAAAIGDLNAGVTATPRPAETLVALVVEKIPFFILSSLLCAITLWAQTTALQLNAQVPLDVRFNNSLAACLTYLGQAIYPCDLVPFYAFNHAAPSIGAICGNVAILAAISSVAFILRKQQPYLLFGWCWFLGMLVPVIGIVHVGAQSHADRYTYLPQIGLYVACSLGMADFIHRRALAIRAVASLGISVVLIILMVTAWQQTSYWKNTETLWQRTLAVDGTNPVAHCALGDLYFSKHNLDAAEAEYQAALKSSRSSFDARLGLGDVLAEHGEFNAAEKYYQSVINDSPNLPTGYAALGKLHTKQHNYNAAIASFEKSLSLKNDSDETHVNIAIALRYANRLNEAMQHEQIALQINPQSVDACRNLANLLASTGHRRDAILYYRKALELSPEDSGSATYLAWILATSPESAGTAPADALALIRPICKLVNPSSAQLDVLAAAYAAAGRFEEAAATATRAERVARSAGNQHAADEIRARLKLYEQHKPFIEFDAPVTNDK